MNGNYYPFPYTNFRLVINYEKCNDRTLEGINRDVSTFLLLYGLLSIGINVSRITYG